jgi:hypothetical protein
MRLVSVKRATDGRHKYVATFEGPNGHIKRTQFGAHGMDDYTITHDTQQRARYRARHAKDLHTGDHTRAGFLSYYILWGPSTSIQENIRAFRSKFRA